VTRQSRPPGGRAATTPERASRAILRQADHLETAPSRVLGLDGPDGPLVDLIAEVRPDLPWSIAASLIREALHAAADAVLDVAWAKTRARLYPAAVDAAHRRHTRPQQLREARRLAGARRPRRRDRHGRDCRCLDCDPTTPAYDRLVDVLQTCGTVRVNGSEAMAQCPAHDDGRPSLHLTHDTARGRVLVKCFAGCDTRDVLAAVGLSLRDLYDRGSTR
jgi:hypothetical protein